MATLGTTVSDDDTGTGMKYEETAYVHGTEEERQRQKDEIQKAFCTFLEGDFVSDWRVVERRRKETEQDNTFLLFVTDLQMLSKNPKEWAERVIVFVNTGALLRPLKYEHREWWDRNCRAVEGMDETSILTFLEKQYDGWIEEEARRQQTENGTATQEADKPMETKEGKRPQKTKQSGKSKRIKRGAGKTKKSGNEKGKNTPTKRTQRKPER